MSVGKDQGHDNSPDLTNEIDRTMAEAEAAVSALEDEDGSSSTDGSNAGTGELSTRIAELEQELATTKDKWLRAVADLDNYRKRVKREVDEAVVRATQNLLPGFLPVIDNLERALEVAEPAVKGASDENAKNVQQLIEGISMVRRDFLAALSRNGIEPVPTVGVPFDPAIHDALQQFDSPDFAPGVVMQEFEKGYKMGERLIRPARVVVAGAGSTGAPAAAEQGDAEA